MGSLERMQLSLSFGQRLKREREQRHLSQEKLAAMVGCDVRSLRRWEQGKGLPDYENRRRLCEALGLDLASFNQLFQEVQTSKTLPEQTLDHQPAQEVNSPPYYTPDHIAAPQEQQHVSFSSGAHFTEGTRPTSSYISGNHLIQETHQAAPHFFPAHQPITIRVDTNTLPERSRKVDQRRRNMLKWGGIALAGLVGCAGGAGAFYWMTKPVTPVYTYYTPAKAGIYDVEWSPKGNYLVCVNKNNVAQVLTASNGLYSPSITGPAFICLTWSPDGTRVAAPGTDHMLHIWNPVNGVDTLRFQDNIRIPRSIAWSHDGKKIALSDYTGLVQIWNAQTGELLLTHHGGKGSTWWISWSPDDTKIASGEDDASVHIWDTTTDNTILTYTGHKRAVVDVKWSPSGKAIVSASEDGTVQIWDTQSGKTKLIYRGHKKSVQAAEWSHDEQTIASAGEDRTIQLWSAQTGKQYTTYQGHTNTIWTLSWSPDGDYLVSASEDGSLMVWRTH